ncbi:ammonia permease [Brevibacterium ihuae]|uniref:ammonia permease n=1 Tax=Brevibacterium ihuae TaxID=1631743 RepID=UPI000C75B36F|nr:ammonia permease [Brevibacterium ihuae]
MTRWIRIVVALCLAAALGVSVYFGLVPFALACGLVVAALAYGWPRLTDSPQPRATTTMLFVLGLIGLATVWIAPTAPFLDWLPLVAGVGLLWAFVQNLVRGIGASHAVVNVSAQVAGLVIILSVASWVGAVQVPGDKEAVIVALVAIILAQAATVVPWPARYTSPLALGIAVLGAATTATIMVDGSMSLWGAAGLGLVMGLLVAATDRMLGLVARSRLQSRELRRARRRDKARLVAVQMALGAAPIALGGIVVYVIERILVFG